MSDNSKRGFVYRIDDKKVISDRLTKQEFVIKSSKNGYDSYFKFQLKNDFIDQIYGVKVDDEIEVKFGVDGSLWEKDGKEIFFTNLDAYNITVLTRSDAEPISSVEPEVPPTAAYSDALDQGDDQTDDLPF